MKHGVKCQAYQADVTVPAQISAAIQQVVQDFGKLDVVVANAGICSEHAGDEYTPEEFQEIMDVNVNGAFYTAQAAANIFKKQGFGNVVFTASVSAVLVNTPQRQAAVGFSSSLCSSLDDGISRTDMNPGSGHTVQCFQSRCPPTRQITRSRMGWFLPGQLRFTGLRPNQHHGVCVAGSPREVVGSDSCPSVCIAIRIKGGKCAYALPVTRPFFNIGFSRHISSVPPMRRVT